MNSDLQGKYLEAMGIQVWVPREAGLRDESAVVQDQQSAGERSGLAEMSFAIEQPAQQSTENVELVGVANEEQQPTLDSVPRFQLAALTIDGTAVVLADYSRDVSPDQNKQEERLLMALGQSLADASSLVSSIARFSWPMFDQANMDQSESVAQAAVRAFCTAQTKGIEIPYLLLFGDRCRAYLKNPGQWENQLQSSRCWEFPALSQLLGDYSSKRKVWSAFCEILSE